MEFFAEIPDEVLLMILTCSPIDFLNWRSVCRRWRNLLDNSYFKYNKSKVLAHSLTRWFFPEDFIIKNKEYMIIYPQAFAVLECSIEFIEHFFESVNSLIELVRQCKCDIMNRQLIKFIYNKAQPIPGVKCCLDGVRLKYGVHRLYYWFNCNSDAEFKQLFRYGVEEICGRLLRVYPVSAALLKEFADEIRDKKLLEHLALNTLHLTGEIIDMFPELLKERSLLGDKSLYCETENLVPKIKEAIKRDTTTDVEEEEFKRLFRRHTIFRTMGIRADEKFYRYIDWNYVLSESVFSKEILLKCGHLIKWELISPSVLNTWPLDYFMENIDYFTSLDNDYGWVAIPYPEEIFRKFIRREEIAKLGAEGAELRLNCYRVSIDFIVEFGHYLDWDIVFETYPGVDCEFVRKYAKHASSSVIPLSTERIIENINLMDWHDMVCNPTLTDEIVYMFHHKIKWTSMDGHLWNKYNRRYKHSGY